jgi:MFS family permease
MGNAEGGRRWVVLGVGLGAMVAGCVFQFGLPYLLPVLRADGLSLGRAGPLVACPTAGLMVSLIAWGAAADRWGERLVLSLGLGAAGLALLAAAAVAGRSLAMGACLAAAGAGGASVHAASGRLILGWFGARERGLAMGVRQTAQPLGVGVAALALPPPATAGRVLAAVQVCGALARIGAGAWSDRAGSRLRPLRLVAAAIAVVMAALAAETYAGSAAAVAVLLAAGAVTVSPNGLAFTAVAECAGQSWAGRALGVQNTAQNVFAMATPPLAGAVVGGPGYGAAFAVAVAFSPAAVPLVPVRGEGRAVTTASTARARADRGR